MSLRPQGAQSDAPSAQKYHSQAVFHFNQHVQYTRFE